MSNYSLEIQRALAAEFAKGWGYKAVHKFWPDIPEGTLRDWGRRFKKGTFPETPPLPPMKTLPSMDPATAEDKTLVMKFILSCRKPQPKQGEQLCLNLEFAD